MKQKKLSLTTWIFISMIVGAVLGLVFGETMCRFKFIGTIWLNSIKLIMVPLVFTIMILAVGRQTNAKTLGRVALRIILYYGVTTVCASIIGICIATILKPGIGLTLDGVEAAELTSAADITFSGFVTGMFSTNLFKSFTEGNMMQVIVIGLMLGSALLLMPSNGEKVRLIELLEAVNSLIYKYIYMVMKVAPIGVLFLIADSFGMYGTKIFGSMAKLIGSIWLSLFIQILLVYGIALILFAHINPIKYLKQTASLWSFTIATCASSAAVPISIDIAKEKFNVDESVAEFCIPLGAQINYDGATVMISCVLVLIMQMNSMPTDFLTLMRMVLVASLIASSGGGIPGGSMIKLLIVAETLGLPTAFVGVVTAFQRLTEMGTASANSLGDLAGTICVDRMEKNRAARAGKTGI